MITVVAVDAPSAGKGLARVTRKTKLAVPPCSWVMEGRSIGSLRELLDDSVGDCLFLGLADRGQPLRKRPMVEMEDKTRLRSFGNRGVEPGEYYENLDPNLATPSSAERDADGCCGCGSDGNISGGASRVGATILSLANYRIDGVFDSASRVIFAWVC